MSAPLGMHLSDQLCLSTSRAKRVLPRPDTSGYIFTAVSSWTKGSPSLSGRGFIHFVSDKHLSEVTLPCHPDLPTFPPRARREFGTSIAPFRLVRLSTAASARSFHSTNINFLDLKVWAKKNRQLIRGTKAELVRCNL